MGFTINSLVNGKCHVCEKPCQFIFVGWCDDCLTADEEYRKEHPEKGSLRWCRTIPEHVAAKHPNEAL